MSSVRDSLSGTGMCMVFAVLSALPLCMAGSFHEKTESTVICTAPCSLKV